MIKYFFQILFYILGFTLVSLLISQIPVVFRGIEFFLNGEETILSIIAGTTSGLIVGFFNLRKVREED